MITSFMVEHLAHVVTYEGRMSDIYHWMNKGLITYLEFKKLDDFFCVPLISQDPDARYNEKSIVSY